MTTEHSGGVHPPATIILATDLGARCDRALDRAVQLALLWDARLVAVHAVEGESGSDLRRMWDGPRRRSPADPLHRAREELYGQLDGQPVEIDVHVEEGRASDVVLAAAERFGAGLIVTGIARDDPLYQPLLGDTVHRMMRKASASLLIVRSRVRAPYGRIVVATDFSPPSRAAFERATRLFPLADFTLFNGYEVPFANYLGLEGTDRRFHEMEQEAVSRFLKEAEISEDARRRTVGLVQRGAPEIVLSDYVHDSRADLTVVGSHGGGAIYEVLIGSTARRIIDAVPGDALLVRSRRLD